MVAIIWVTNDGDIKSTYSVGTFVASTSDSKEFTHRNEQISYEAGILGTTTTVRLSKAP